MNTTAQDNSHSLRDLARGSMPIEDPKFATDAMPFEFEPAPRRQEPGQSKGSPLH